MAMGLCGEPGGWVACPPVSSERLKRRGPGVIDSQLAGRDSPGRTAQLLRLMVSWRRFRQPMVEDGSSWRRRCGSPELPNGHVIFSNGSP